MKDKQQGAALVIVMALLSGALMIGISGMNSALIDERLAGNYRAAALAQMNAERAVSQALHEFYEGQRSNQNSWGSARSLDSIDDVGDIFFDKENDPSWCDGSYNRCAYEFLVIGDVYSIIAKGRVVEESVDRVISESSFVRINLFYSPPLSSDPPDDPYPVDEDVKELLDKIIASGDFIHVLDEYDFSGSNNDKAESWEDKISVDSSLFDSPESVCLFKDSLLSGGIANGLVRELSGKVKKDDLSNASGKIAVVTEDGFSLPNDSDFTGVLMIFGKDFKITGGGNVDFNGAIIHVPVDCVASEFYTPQIDIRGGNGSYNLSAIESIINQLDIDDENDNPGGDGGVVSSNNDLEIVEWQWSFD